MTAKAYLVETLPPGLAEMAPTGANSSTLDALLRLARGAQDSIDLTAMYWNLRPEPGGQGVEELSRAEMDALGIDAGHALYESLERAAARGVNIRIVQSPGFSPGRSEGDVLAAAYPERVAVRTVRTDAWYGSGIMHQKLWLVDGRRLYLGSANMDWCSLTHVKEMGVVVEEDKALVADAGRHFETAWRFADLAPRPASGGRLPLVATAFDPAVALARPVPCWSSLLPPADRCPSPLDDAALRTPYGPEKALAVRWNGTAAHAFIAGSPPELCPAGRATELDALLRLIGRARERIAISAMHFLPAGRDATVWWPALQDALLRTVCRGVDVRLLASHWPYNPPRMFPHLRALEATAAACTTSSERPGGRLAVRAMVLPGWEQTTGAGQRYPGHSRVNHPKFALSESNLQVSTSNVTWSDYHQNVGASLQTDHAGLVQQGWAIFERDWGSPYAVPLAAL